MESLAILIPVAIVLALVILGVFVWAARSGQFDDLERHGSDPLFDDETANSRDSNAEQLEQKAD